MDQEVEVKRLIKDDFSLIFDFRPYESGIIAHYKNRAIVKN